MCHVALDVMGEGRGITKKEVDRIWTNGSASVGHQQIPDLGYKKDAFLEPSLVSNFSSSNHTFTTTSTISYHQPNQSVTMLSQQSSPVASSCGSSCRGALLMDLVVRLILWIGLTRTPSGSGRNDQQPHVCEGVRREHFCCQRRETNHKV